MSEEIAVHCWADRWEVESKAFEYASNEWSALFVETHGSCGGVDATCFLEDGHDGPHEWTPDSACGVTIAFAEVQP